MRKQKKGKGKKLKKGNKGKKEIEKWERVKSNEK